MFETMGYRALSQAATVLSYAVLVRNMSEQGFGVLNLLYSVIPVLNTFGSLGLDHALRRYQPEYLRGGDEAAANWLFKVVRRLRFFSNVVLMTIALLLWNWVAPLFELGPYRTDFAIFCLLILLYFQINLLQYALASQMLHRYSVGSIAVSSGVKLVAYCLLALFGELTLRHAVLADLAAYALSYAFLWRAHNRATAAGTSPVTKPDEQQRQRIRRYAIYSHWNDAASILQYSETDRWFVAALLNPIVVGTYAFYTRLSEMVTSFVPQRLFDNIVQPLFFSVAKSDAPEKIPRYFTFLINLSLIFQLPLISFVTVYHHDIVLTIFGDTYVHYSFLLPMVVAFSTTDNVFSVPIHLVAQYSEKAPVILKSQILGFYQIAAMLLLVPAIGLAGAVIASGTFHVLRNLFVWWHVRHEGIWMNFRSVILTTLVIWGATIWLSFTIRNAITLPPIMEMIVGLCICGVATLVYVRSPAISSSDRHILGNLLHGREGRLLRIVGLLPGHAP